MIKGKENNSLHYIISCSIIRVLDRVLYFINNGNISGLKLYIEKMHKYHLFIVQSYEKYKQEKLF